MSDVASTFLHHKPVIYGSSAANAIFLAILLFHIVAGAIAPVCAVVAVTARKGGQSHVLSGRFFSGSMVLVVLTGIILDGIRLCFFISENHTKYSNYSMPSTYPARLGFVFVGLCVLYILREVSPPRIFHRQILSTMIGVESVLLLITGVALTVIIALYLNPWTGALWMIWTFSFIVFIIARSSALTLTDDRGKAVVRHRFGMSCLAAFSWWGALQGFGPGIRIAIQGVDPTTRVYLGNQPGSFSPDFFFFLMSWVPFFMLADYLTRRAFSPRQR